MVHTLITISVSRNICNNQVSVIILSSKNIENDCISAFVIKGVHKYNDKTEFQCPARSTHSVSSRAITKKNGFLFILFIFLYIEGKESLRVNTMQFTIKLIHPRDIILLIILYWRLFFKLSETLLLCFKSYKIWSHGTFANLYRINISKEYHFIIFL